ncbi:DegV family protein, partial [Eggerthella lenta]
RSLACIQVYTLSWFLLLFSVVNDTRFIWRNLAPSCPKKRYRSENLIARAKMAFLPMDLSFLRAGGRLSSIKYATSQVLNIRPVVEMRDGALSMTRKFHGSTKRVATKFLEAFLSDGAIDRQQLILLYSCGLPSKICEAVTERAKNLGVQEVHWVQTGCVVTAHCGPSAIGFAALRSE